MIDKQKCVMQENELQLQKVMKEMELENEKYIEKEKIEAKKEVALEQIAAVTKIAESKTAAIERMEEQRKVDIIGMQQTQNMFLRELVLKADDPLAAFEKVKDHFAIGYNTNAYDAISRIPIMDTPRSTSPKSVRSSDKPNLFLNEKVEDDTTNDATAAESEATNIDTTADKF